MGSSDSCKVPYRPHFDTDTAQVFNLGFTITERQNLYWQSPFRLEAERCLLTFTRFTKGTGSGLGVPPYVVESCVQCGDLTVEDTSMEIPDLGRNTLRWPDRGTPPSRDAGPHNF